MDVVGVLRLLWRRRLPVAAGIGIALAIAILMAFKVQLNGSSMFESRQYDVGVAAASVLLDSQSSQVVDLGGGQDDQPALDVSALSSRARLLATLMSTRPLKDRIAAPAGVPSHTLVTRVTADLPDVAPAPVTTGTTVRASDPEANVMTLQTSETLPIITINTQAPSVAVAEKLATSAVTQLRLYMKTVAASNRVPSARQLVVTPLGPANSAAILKGPRRLWAVAAFLLVLGSWCAGIVLLSTVARKWRDADRVESLQPQSGPGPSGPGTPAHGQRRTDSEGALGHRDRRPDDEGFASAPERVSRTTLVRR